MLGLVVALCGASGAADAQAPLAAGARGDASIGSRLDALAAEGERLGATIAVAAMDFESGATIYARDARTAKVPASVQKLATVAAAFEVLGVEHRFDTRFELRDGWVEVACGADPNWRTDDDRFDPRLLLVPVVRALRAARVDAVRGVRLRPGAFTGPTRPAGWPARQHARRYAAPTGAAALDAGCLRVAIASAGGAAGRPATVRVVGPPLDGLEQVGRIVLTDDRKKGGLYHVGSEGLRIRLRGHFDRRVRERVVEVAADDAELLFTATVERVLRDAGIVVRSDAPARTRDEPLARVETPLGPAVTAALQDSSNWHAEMLARTVGARVADDGSLAGGAAAVRDVLENRLGIELSADAVIDDGSGLSRGNRLAAADVVALLERALERPWSSAFLAALAQGGVSGTLAKRFRDGPFAGRVRAKTGTLNGVSSLAGIVQRRSGGLVAFAILTSWRGRAGGASASAMRRLQDRMVTALGESR